MKIVTPELGTSKADKVTRTQIAKLHAKLHKTPFQANRVLAVMGSMYAFAGELAPCRRAPIPSARSTNSRNTVASGSSPAQSLNGSAQPSERQRRKAFRGRLMRRSPRQGTFQSQKIAVPRSVPSRGRPFAAAVHRDAGCGKSCVCGGNTSILSGACFSSRQQERQKDYDFECPRNGGADELDRLALTLCREMTPRSRVPI